jgi:hypothetical protein
MVRKIGAIGCGGRVAFFGGGGQLRYHLGDSRNLAGGLWGEEFRRCINLASRNYEHATSAAKAFAVAGVYGTTEVVP